MIELIIGGARSGKSSYALKQAQKTHLLLHFIATAEAGDDEMRQRISRHQHERGPRWRLIEEPLFLAAQFAQFSEADCVLIDCLTLWLSNWLCRHDQMAWQVERKKFITALKCSPATILLVSNETGMGVIPADAMSRQFSDQSGRLHQQLAKISDRVSLLICGLHQTLKEKNEEKNEEKNKEK